MAVGKSPQAQLILIDTAGRSLNEAVARQAELIRSIPGVELHLVMSAATGARQMAAVADRYKALNPDRVIFYWLEQADAAMRFRTNAYVFDQMSTIHSFFPQLLIAFHRVDDVADMEAYVNRIRESGRALRQLIEVSKQNATTGVRPPRFAYDAVIDSSTKIITGQPFTESGPDSSVWADAKAKVAALFRIPEERITHFAVFEPANAIKFTVRRLRPSGSPGETDVFGSQQYAPLFDVEVP